MAEPTYEGAGLNKTYNAGVWRVPGVTQPSTTRSIEADEQLFADLLPDKDIVGGQVAKGFKGGVGTPLKRVSEGVYDAADVGTDVVAGVLLLATDAYDAPRTINVVKGGTIKTTVSGIKDLDAEALATALDGVYDEDRKYIKF